MRSTRSSRSSQVEKGIQGLAPTYADELRSMGHSKITLDTQPDDPLYLKMIDKQIRWLKMNQVVADIYTFRKHPDGNQLIVDSETDYDRNGKYDGNYESVHRQHSIVTCSMV